MGQAYSYSGKCTSSHILAKGEVGRKSFISVCRVSNRYLLEDREKIMNPRSGRYTYSYSSPASVFGRAIGAATATESPPYAFDCKASLPDCALQLNHQEDLGIDLVLLMQCLCVDAGGEGCVEERSSDRRFFLMMMACSLQVTFEGSRCRGQDGPRRARGPLK